MLSRTLLLRWFVILTMATSTADFPLATDDPYPGGSSPGGAIDDAAGAAGSSPGAAQLSHGALIAIIVVVAVVVVLGSEYKIPNLGRRTHRIADFIQYQLLYCSS